MRRPLIALFFLLVVCLQPGHPQQPDPQEPKGAPAPSPNGVQVGPVPELLYEHLQLVGLKRGHGAVVEQVVADSVAFQAGLKRHDILLSYDGTSIRDGKHFLKLLGTATRKAPLVLLRSGQKMTLEVSFASTPSSTAHDSPKGWSKPDGPPAVDVEAQPLEGGKLSITFTFYSTGKGKLDQLTCSGSLTEIQDQVRVLGKRQDIPARVQDLIEVALKRLRSLNLP